MPKLTQALDSALLQFDEIVLATMVDHRGSAPQVNGAKAIISREGLFWGTVGGGKLELAVIQRAFDLLEAGPATDFFKWNLQTDVGMSCGGEASFFLEKFGRAKFQLAIFGAGHISQALIPMLLKLDCFISCIDSRDEWLDKLPDSSRLQKICLENPCDYISNLPEGCFVLSITQGHKYDVPILQKAFERGDDFPYIGTIGSEQKAQVIKKDLRHLGVNDCDLERLFCPLGLRFGNNIPEEIAFSIIAQLLTERDLLS